MPDVGATSNVGAHKFTKQRTTGETLFGGEDRAVFGSFGGTDRFVWLWNCCGRQRPAVRRVFEGRRVPHVSSQHSRDAGRTRGLDGVTGLFDLDAIVFGEETTT